jgi:hypothetical protein
MKSNRKTSSLALAIDCVLTNKNVKSVVIYTHNDTKRIPKKIKVTLQGKRIGRSGTSTLLVTFGRLSYSEREYAIKFYAEYDMWPADNTIYYPKKKAA